MCKVTVSRMRERYAQTVLTFRITYVYTAQVPAYSIKTINYQFPPEKVKVKWSRYRPGVAQRLGRCIALLFHDRGTRRGWVVSSTPRPHFTPGKDRVHILQDAGWAAGPVWTGGKSCPHREFFLFVTVQLFCQHSTIIHINIPALQHSKSNGTMQFSYFFKIFHLLVRNSVHIVCIQIPVLIVSSLWEPI